MAEIKIEKKSNIWPWVIGALVLLALLIYFLTRDDDRDDAYGAGDRDTTTQVVDNNYADGGAVADYENYLAENDTMGMNHEYTSGAFRRLTNAVRAKADQVNHDISVDLNKVEEYNDRITSNPDETTHANTIKEAAGLLANAMGNLQQAKFPDQNDLMKQVRDAANSIKTDVQTLNQRNEVKGFLNKSAELLKNMNQ